MFARITRYKVKKESVEAAKELTERLKDDIMALPGILHFINAIGSDGSGYIVSLVESSEQSEASREQVKALWAHFGDYLEEIPQPEGYEVFAHWSN